MTGPRANGYRKFFWLAASIGSAALIGTATTFVSMQVNSATLSTQIDVVQRDLTEIKADVKVDRVSVLGLISQNASEISKLRESVARLQQQVESRR